MDNQTTNNGPNADDSNELLEPLITAEAKWEAKASLEGEKKYHMNKEDIVVDAVPDSDEFPIGTRTQVNGASVVFFVAGCVLTGGPIGGAAAAALGAHAAANKTGRFANFARYCGSFLDNVSKDKKGSSAADKSEAHAAVVVAEEKQKDNATDVKEKDLWSKITDKLIHGAECFERRFLRRQQEPDEVNETTK